MEKVRQGGEPGSQGQMSPEDAKAHARMLMEFDARSRALESRAKAEGAGGSVRPVGETDLLYANYFSNYSRLMTAQLTMDNVLSSRQNAVFLYDSPGRGLAHVIWMGKSPNEYWADIPRDEWVALKSKPETMERASRVMVESYNQALEFYGWSEKPKGFVVEGSRGFGLEAGNVHGVRVSLQNISPLIKALESGDTAKVQRLRKHFTGEVIHEMTHNERDDGLISQVRTEIASHAAQLIFDPKDNVVYNRQLDESLGNIRKSRAGAAKPGVYDKAQYAALLIVAERVAGNNPAFMDAVKADGDANKLGALARLPKLISADDERRLREDALPWVMKEDGVRLLESAREVEKRWGVRPGVLDDA